MWTTLRVARQPRPRLQQQKNAIQQYNGKRFILPEPWKKIATPLAMRSRVSASLQSPAGTASPPLSALAASLRRRHVGSGGMSDPLSHQGNETLKAVMRREANRRWQGMFSNASQASRERPQSAEPWAAARDVPACPKKRCTSFHGGLNTVPENPHASEFL